MCPRTGPKYTVDVERPSERHGRFLTDSSFPENGRDALGDPALIEQVDDEQWLRVRCSSRLARGRVPGQNVWRMMMAVVVVVEREGEKVVRVPWPPLQRLETSSGCGGGAVRWTRAQRKAIDSSPIHRHCSVYDPWAD
uniref:Uncharacterized protein n=1 Tax=Eutreptiella gymnastica TaxID=73025 RepID=A0A7S4CWB2_9EUGL|mmetsp:Transcript_101032/g.170876  ORF Transcript_101032/g.170876 Transcript_101032/m.170876 type:complete len:138 (+) Transcript_101032:167-580(+)